MIPFRIYDREKREMWICLNYHTSSNEYLVARDDEGETDGDLQLLKADAIAKMKLVDFIEEDDDGF